MTRFRLVLFSALFLLGFVGFARTVTGQDTINVRNMTEAAHRVYGWGLYLEEDAFYPPSNEDRNYTAGFGFAVSGPIVRRALLDLPLRAIDRLTGVENRLHGRKNVGDHFESFQLSGSAFTPDSLRATEVVLGDRPYASIVTLSAMRTTTSTNEETAWTSELAVGALGLNLGRNIQRAIHRHSRARTGKPVPVDPKGWPNQISNGGEPTARYALGYQRLLPRLPAWFELTGGARGELGYYTNVAGSFTGRVGRIRSKFWEYKLNPLSGVSRAPSGAGDWELFLVGGARPLLVGYNALLQGQFRHSNYTMPASMVKRVVLEYEGGIAASVFGKSHGVQVTVLYPAGRTPEFGGNFKRTHQWASVFLSAR